MDVTFYRCHHHLAELVGHPPPLQQVRFQDLVSETSFRVPRLELLVSIYSDGSMRTPLGLLSADARPEDLVVTFEGLVTRTTFMKQIRAIMMTLEENSRHVSRHRVCP